MGAPGMVLCTHSVVSAVGIGFMWDPLMPGWTRHGLPGLSNLAGPIQHFKSATLHAWRSQVSASLCAREGFRGGTLVDTVGSSAACQLVSRSRKR